MLSPSGVARAPSDRQLCNNIVVDLSWPIHVKPVTKANHDAIESLPGVEGSTTVEVWVVARRWLEDDNIYAENNVPVRGAEGLPCARYQQRWIDALVEHGVIEQIRDRSVRGHVLLYAIPEPQKQRFRAIMHTKDINDSCGRDTLLPCVFPTKFDIAAGVHDGEWSVSLDFAAYYYQFQLAPAVGNRMCFRFNGRAYALRREAMGQRQAVGVAVAATNRLLDFQHRSTSVKSIIDNVLFTGSKDAVIDDACEFIERCKRVNATLNDIDVQTATREEVAALARQVSSWGGVQFDLRSREVCDDEGHCGKTVQIMSKAAQKTAQSWDLRAAWTWRNYAAHIGMLFWAWGILDLPMASYFDVLRFNSAVGKMATDELETERARLGVRADVLIENPFWSRPAEVWQSVWSDLERWTRDVISNRPRYVLPAGELHVLLECDASKEGWCFFAFDLWSSMSIVRSSKWTEQQQRRYGDRLHQSTTAESLAITFSLQAARRVWPDARRFGVLSDSVVAIVSHTRGFNSRSYYINSCVVERLLSMPSADFPVEFRHVPGKDNIADAGSRGAAVAGAMSEGEKDTLRAHWRNGAGWGGNDVPSDSSPEDDEGLDGDEEPSP